VLIARNVTRSTTLASRVEVGDSFMAKFMGLMGRARLDSDAGLWLPDDNGIHMMFMRFAIDAVFVGRPDADGSRPVLAVRRALRPWTGIVPLVRGARGVIELAVGTIDASRTAEGDLVRLDPA
jgi:uncharacterized protein